MAKRKLIKYTLNKVVDGELTPLRHKESKASLRRWLNKQVKDLTLNEKRKVLEAFYDPHVNQREWRGPIIEFLLKAAINEKIKQVTNNEIHIKDKVYMITKEE